MKFRFALAIECVGVALVIGCSLAPLPFVSSESGTASDITWGRSDEPDYVAIGGDYFYLKSSTRPATPGPAEGEGIRVDFLDDAAGPIVLDVIVAPDTSSSTRYVTSEGSSFEADNGLHYAALGGLVTGVVLTVIGLFLVIRIGRRSGAAAGAIAVAVAPLSALALIALLGQWSGLSTLAKLAEAGSFVWIVAALTALVAALVGRDDDEPAYAGAVLWLVLISNGVWLAWWAGALINYLNRSMF